jgi:FKBP-type peptidyl-prolyl cis-trans isomerase
VRSSAAKALIGLGLGTVLLLVAACGKDASSPSASTTPTASPSTPSASPSGTPAKVTPSTNFDKVTVTGDYGKAPKVEIKAPWGIDKTRTKALKANPSAPAVKQGATVEVNYAGYNGRTGKKFDDSFIRGSTASFNIDQVVPGFKKGLLGQHQGSRVLVAMPGPDGYDASGGNPDIDVRVGDTLVFVVDIVAVPLTGPEGTPVTPKSGLPTVTDKGGKPQITIPKSKPPSELQVQPLIKGKGKKVAETDSITFNYIWQTWSDGKVVEHTYNSKPATAPLSELVPGLVTGLTGQTVGSRVLLVIPPAQGYPDGNASPKIGKNQTLVFVVDLLFSQS